MNPVNQTILHEPSDGRYGNCMQAVVASALELSIDAVPHFLHDNTQDGALFNRRINEFLRPFNLAYLSFPQFKAAFDSFGIRGLVHEISGPGARGVEHACVAIDGEITHDPHPSRNGLIEIDHYGVFVVLDPSKPIGKSMEATNATE